MKKIFFAVVIFSITFIEPSIAQMGQTLLWGDSMFVAPIYGIIDNNNNIVICGSDANAPQQAYLIKIKDNEINNLYFHPYISDTNGTYYLNVIQLSNYNYLCIGCEYSGDENIKSKIIVTVLDTNMNLVNENTFYLPPDYSRGYFFEPILEEGDTVLYAFSAKIPYAYGDKEYDLGFIRVTPLGDTIESKYYHYDFNPLGGAVKVYDFKKMPDSDKYFVLCDFDHPQTNDYWTFIINPDLSIDTMYGYGTIFGLNTNGRRRVGFWKNNKMLIGGDYFTFSSNDIALFVGIIDLYGNVIDYTILEQIGIDELSATTNPIAGANDSTIYVVGYDMCYTCNPITDVAILEVYTVNSALDVLGYNVIADDGFYRASGVLTNDDGDLIVYGTKNVGDTFNYNLFVTQIPRAELGLTTSVKDIEKKPGFQAFPNPATDKINLYAGYENLSDGVRIILRTVNGKTVLNKPVCGNGTTIEIDISSLPATVYIYQILKNNNIISQGKFIKQ